MGPLGVEVEGCRERACDHREGVGEGVMEARGKTLENYVVGGNESCFLKGTEGYQLGMASSSMSSVTS